LIKTYIFDACALIALLTEENGYRNVEKIIEESKNNRAQIIMHNVNLLEVYYDIYKLYDETKAIKFLDEIKNAPMSLRAAK
jgi:PIN domain nuclease of toxin-antitoxin system